MSNRDKIYLWRGRVIYHGSDGFPYVPETLPDACYTTS